MPSIGEGRCSSEARRHRVAPVRCAWRTTSAFEPSSGTGPFLLHGLRMVPRFRLAVSRHAPTETATTPRGIHVSFPHLHVPLLRLARRHHRVPRTRPRLRPRQDRARRRQRNRQVDPVEAAGR
ncbi:hypothetical protein SGPA1_10323 [Streptomyces misionensis JCM 4497]